MASQGFRSKSRTVLSSSRPSSGGGFAHGAPGSTSATPLEATGMDLVQPSPARLQGASGSGGPRALPSRAAGHTDTRKP